VHKYKVLSVRKSTLLTNRKSKEYTNNKKLFTNRCYTLSIHFIKSYIQKETKFFSGKWASTQLFRFTFCGPCVIFVCSANWINGSYKPLWNIEHVQTRIHPSINIPSLLHHHISASFYVLIWTFTTTQEMISWGKSFSNKQHLFEIGVKKYLYYKFIWTMNLKLQAKTKVIG